MSASDPTRFSFLSTRELLVHRAKLNRVERRRRLPAQARSLRQAIEDELERRRIARMDRFARGASEFTVDIFEHTDRIQNRAGEKRTTK
ncbi:MAG: hypothetical protein CBC34_016200 [Hyphomicrobiaceae bacterium TMED74]|nr:hypothetical protein [Filomicrobium sp.]RPG38462.1 MAG: hypothetical protein CBC34_016200 [Hyphomicrobiaceae bacterium TMED74]